MVRQATGAAGFAVHLRVVGGVVGAAVSLTGLLAATLVATLTATVAAQTGPGKPGTGAKSVSKPGAAGPDTKQSKAATDDRKLLDRVMMTVDNRVIRLSEVEDEYRAMVQQQLNAGVKLDARARMLIYHQARFKFLRAAMEAQSAWSIQGFTPERIQQIVDQQLQKRQQDRIKEFGSINQMQQDMGLLSKSEFIQERREREEILQQIAKQDFRMRFRDRLALMITPKALRAHYKLRRPAMKTTASVDLAIVRFALGTDPAATETRATAAAKKWEDSFQTGAEVALEFDGDALPEQKYRNLTAARTANLLPFIREFVANAGRDTVSAPIRSGNSIYLLKVTNQAPGNDFRWEDPAVQNLLREELVRKAYDRILQRLDREREKTLKIWPPLDRGRR